MTPKLLITSVPWTDTQSPLMAPALLKTMCVNAGVDTTAFDLNQEFLTFVKSKYSNEDQKNLQKFFYNNTKVIKINQVIECINFCVDKILSHSPTHIALSLLSYTSQICCEWICFKLKLLMPNLKIIIGGAGVFSTLESKQNLGATLLAQQQIDYFIKGDGDISLPELVLGKKNEIKGVNETSWQQVDDLNGKPFPDYSDYNLDLYNRKSIGIVGSRGCVRRCTFCDIHEHWKKYQWRTGEDIFKELVWHNEKTGIRKFKFNDSLINGNHVEFKKLMKLLAKHNDANPTNAFKWSSFFIFRPQSQIMEQDWIDISKSADVLTVGIESFNENVRFHMGKKFTDQDMHYCFDMCSKYKIKVNVLLIVGYVTDNELTNKKTIEWFENNKHYADSPITGVSFGGTLGILPGTEIYRKQKELGIILNNEQFDHNWSLKNENNTAEVRLRWHKEQTMACKKAGFTVTSSVDNFLLMEQMMQ